MDLLQRAPLPLGQTASTRSTRNGLIVVAAVAAAKPGAVICVTEGTYAEQIKPGADAIVTKLRGMSAMPDGIEVTFGLKMSANAGAFIAASGVEANFTVVLKWNRS